MTTVPLLNPNHFFKNHECWADVLSEMAQALNRFSSFRSSKTEDTFCIILSLLNLSVSTSINGVHPESSREARRHFYNAGKANKAHFLVKNH